MVWRQETCSEGRKFHLDRNDEGIRRHNHDWRELNAGYTEIREKDKKEGQGMRRMQV